MDKTTGKPGAVSDKSECSGSLPKLSDEDKAIKMLGYLKRTKRESGKVAYDVQMMLGLLDLVKDLEAENDLNQLEQN